MKKNLLMLGALVIALGAIAFVFTMNGTKSPVASDRLRVVASFYPIAEFSRQVGGDLVAVETITPAGAEPHDYEPSPKEIADAYAADALLYNGGGVDAWATKVAPQAEASGVTVAEMSSAVATLPVAEGGEEAAFDPHFWLDPALAQKEVALIRDAFSSADPANAAVYAKNAAAYSAKLDRLDKEFAAGLKDCSTRTVVTSHAAFAYLSKRYGFQAVAITGISPDEEPSAGRLAEIAALAKAKGIKYIYFETLVSPKLSETIAKEIGARTLVFNPLEGLTDAQIADGQDYLTVMEDNLANLRTGMVCR